MSLDLRARHCGSKISMSLCMFEDSKAMYIANYIATPSREILDSLTPVARIAGMSTILHD